MISQSDKIVITWPTNFNNKLGCNSMVHIDLAPRAGVPESWLNEKIIEIRTADNTFPPTTWKLWSLRRFRLRELIDVETMPSHGVKSADFLEFIRTRHPEATRETPMAVYYYYRIDI